MEKRQLKRPQSKAISLRDQKRQLKFKKKYNEQLDSKSGENINSKTLIDRAKRMEIARRDTHV